MVEFKLHTTEDPSVQLFTAGLPGEKGDTGAQGPQGIQGERGEKGDKGDTYNITDIDYTIIKDMVLNSLNNLDEGVY